MNVNESFEPPKAAQLVVWAFPLKLQVDVDRE